MARELSEGLRKKQELQKQETIKCIQDAIDMIKEIGYEQITISNLVSETKLARSTFSKPHVQEVLEKNKIGKYREVKTIVSEIQSNYDKKNIEELERKVQNFQVKINKLESELVSTNAKLKEERLKHLETELLNKELVGKFQSMYDKVIALGIEVIL